MRPNTAAASSSEDGGLSMPEEYLERVDKFFIRNGIAVHLDDAQRSMDFYSFLFRGLLKVNHIDRGKVSCFFTVQPAFLNTFGGLHGGVVGGISERVVIACARTVVGEDKGLFLGELSMSYLSAAHVNEVCIVDGKIVRCGRNITVVGIELRIEKTMKLMYTARATFYHVMPPPIAKL